MGQPKKRESEVKNNTKTKKRNEFTFSISGLFRLLSPALIIEKGFRFSRAEYGFLI